MPVYKTTQAIADSYGYSDLLKSPKDETLSNEVCRKICEWMEGHQGKEPSTTSTDPEEKYFGTWVSHKRKDKQGSGSFFFPSNQDIAEKFGYPDLFNNLEGKSNKKCSEVCLWVKAHGKIPSCKAMNDKEQELGVWLNFRKMAKKKTGNWKFYPSDQAIAEINGLPSLFEIESDEVISNNLCKEVCIWMIDHGKEPSSSSKDNKEKLYGSWIARKRKSNYPSNQAIAESYGFPDLFSSLEERSNKICHELCIWMKEWGREPNKNKKEEKYLGQWLGQRRQNKKGTGSPFYPSNQAIAESYGFIHLFEIKNKEEISNEKCHEVCQWIRTNKRYPSTEGQGEEKKLGKWLSHKRDNKKNKRKTFYPSDLAIAESYGYHDLFETKKR